MAWKASGKTNLPVAGEDKEWDGDSAKNAIFKWAGWPDKKDPQKARQGFFAYDDGQDEEKEGYKLPFATVIDGKLTAVPHGIHAVSVVLEGGRGGVDLPGDVIAEVRDKVGRYYDKMGEKVPW